MGLNGLLAGALLLCLQTCSTLVEGVWRTAVLRRSVSYLRVSIDRQGRSGLGLEAQRATGAAHLDGDAWTLLDKMVEVESGKAIAKRP